MIAPRRILSCFASRAMVLGAVMVIGSAFVLFSDAGMRLLLAESTPLSDESGHRWVILTQDGDCDAFLRRANQFARAAGWPRPVRVRSVVLGSRQAVRPGLLLEPESLGSVRDYLIHWAIFARGQRATPILVRIGGAADRVLITSLERLPE